MPYITNYQYYENGGNVPLDANHGSYQYLTLPDIINNYMLFYVGNDKIVDNVNKYTVRFHTKQIIKMLNYNALRSFRVLESLIGSDLKLIMPPDYVDYVRISIERSGVLYPLVQSNKTMSAEAYLLDNNGDLQFDGDGTVLYGTSDLDTARLAGTETVDPAVEGCCVYSIGEQYGLNTSEANSNPSYSIDRDNGVINFDSTMRDELVVLEYISDGMKGGIDTNIVVNKFFEQYLYLETTARILNTKRDIAAVTKKQAKKDAYAELRNARISISDIDPSRLFMTLRGQDKIMK